MALRLAIIGLDSHLRPWLDAVESLRASAEVDLVAIGHRSLAAAKDVASVFKPADAPVYDDLRLLLQERAPQIILLDRPTNASLEFLLTCLAQDIALLSLGPPVESLADAQALAGALPPRSHLLCIWPRFADSPAYRHAAEAHEFVRPIRFAQASWMGLNYALARTRSAALPGQLADLPVRSLSVLAWDALATLIDLMDVPASVFAAIRGSVGAGNALADLSGAAALTLRFSDDAAAALTLCDRAPLDSIEPRQLLLLGQAGALRLTDRRYEFRDADGQSLDAGSVAAPSARDEALAALRAFLDQVRQPPSPHRGWVHRLDAVAATMEAMVVSHRTGQAESPDRFRHLRR